MPEYTDVLRWIDEQDAAMRRLTRELADINSGTDNLPGLARVADRIVQEMSALPARVERLATQPRTVVQNSGAIVEQPLGEALRATREVAKPDAPRVLLCIHYDTVYGSDHALQQCAQIDDNNLRGPGVADAKGGIVILLTALAALERSAFAGKIAWQILLVPDEEIGSPGSRHLLDEAAKGNDIGLLFEPALEGGYLAGARKGSGNFTLIVRGKAAHAGRNPRDGRNAMHAAAEFVTSLVWQAKQLVGVTVNVGRIDGGGPVNVVPDLAIVRFNVRLASYAAQPALEAIIAERVAALNQRDGFRAELHGSITSPPKPLDEWTLALLQAIAACGSELKIPIAWRDTGGVCDGNKLTAAGLPNVDTLGPRGGSIHSENEYLLLDSLTERAKLTALFLMKLA